MTYWHILKTFIKTPIKTKIVLIDNQELLLENKIRYNLQENMFEIFELQKEKKLRNTRKIY